MSLAFLNPALLWGLLAAALPLVIHLFFRRRPKPTPFPAIDFVLRARRQTEQRLRLKKLLLFTARTLLLAAAALAIARPRAERPAAAAAGGGEGPQATVIVLDASASMQYRLGGRPLFERARADALAALTSLGGEEPASALVCDGRPPAAPAPAFDKAAVRRLLDEATVGSGHADLTSCLAAAARALGEARAQERLGKRIVVVTDLTAAAWRLDVPPPEVPGQAGEGAVGPRTGPVRPRVEVVDAARGAELPNAAVTTLLAEPDPAVGPRGYRLTAAVSGTGAAQKDVPLVLRVGGEARPAIRAFVDVPAGATARKTLSHAFAAGGPATVSVALPGDALPLDDERVLTVTVPREVRALVVDGSPSPVKYRDEAYFVESALGSPASPVRPALIDAEALREADLSKFDVVFLLNVRSTGGRGADLRRFVEAGGGLFVSMGDQVEPDGYDRELPGLLPLPLHLVKTAAARGGVAPGGAAGAGGPTAEARPAQLARIDEAHPALAVFTGEAREGLLGARFYRYMLTRPAPRGEAPVVLAAFDDGAPALVEARRGRGRVLLFTSSADRDWNDWPIRTSFLPAMQRFAAWLSGALEERRDQPSVVGTPRRVRLGEGRALQALVGPDGKERSRRELEAAGLEVADGGEAFTFTPREPGLWQVKVAERAAERLEASLAFAVVPDPRESDTRRLAPGELTAWLGGEAHARVDGQGAPAATQGVPLWTWLLAAAVALLLAEGFLLG